ncbi:HlyD family efflux transporter periplasmic adaptor subunit [Scandinavium sp. NPDC088450]|uniref:HlyD family efflux transporter periplasmic adaptor subunit n=1 Tax=Scandinavium sp. NPDC088450 TaxID=3364514 RepID=UPI00384EFBAD
MDTARPLLTSATQTPPWPKLRDELRLHSASANRDGSPAWHLADPVRNLFFRLGWLEMEILQRWSLGSAEKIAAAIEAETTLFVEEQDVVEFVVYLQQQQLLRTARYRPEKSLWQHLLHTYLFIRIPLIHPQRMLQALMPWVNGLFSLPFLLLTLLVALTGIVLATRQWDSVVASLHNAVSWHGALAFAVALVFSKLWHELGHAFTATRHGVRVGHMGVALLVMLPMAYTDTGESWKLSRSTERFRIAAAGIISELVLAGWATFLWSFTPEGSIKNALFFLATTAWVMTVVVNASPFMRFDGYFILSDLLDFPGLHERAGNWAKRWLRWHLIGLRDPLPDNVTPAFARFLTLFAFVTWIYRLMLFIGIALVVYHAFFKALGVILFLVEIMTFVVYPVWRELRVWYERRSEIQPRRRWRLFALLAVLGAVLFVPWSGRVSLDGVFESALVQPVYTPFPAKLTQIHVSDGERVKAGEALFELQASVPQDAQDRARALHQAWENSARGALALAKDGPAKQVIAEQMMRQYQLEASAGAIELQRLRLVAAADGVVTDSDITLQPGNWVSPGEPIAMVIDDRHWRVRALVREEDLSRIATGAQAKVWLSGRWKPMIGEVVSVDHEAVKTLPSLILAKNHGGPVALNAQAPVKDLRPDSVWYRVSIEGETADHNVGHEQTVQVAINTEKQSLAHRWLNSIILMLIQQTGFGKEA